MLKGRCAFFENVPAFLEKCCFVRDMGLRVGKELAVCESLSGGLIPIFFTFTYKTQRGVMPPRSAPVVADAARSIGTTGPGRPPPVSSAALRFGRATQ